MMRAASVISVIGFMLFILFEPSVPERSEITEAMPAVKAEQIEKTDTNITEDVMASMAFVTFPGHMTSADIIEPVPDVEPVSSKPAPEKPVQAEKLPPQPVSDPAMPIPLKPLMANMANAKAMPAEPELSAMPAPLMPAKTKAPLLDKALLPVVVPVVVPATDQVEVQVQVQDMTAALTPLAALPEPAVKEQDTAIPTAAPVLVADFQSHRMAMQHLEQSDDMLDLELFWPEHAADRGNVAQILRQCFGMTTGYLTADRNLYYIRNQSVVTANRILYSPYSRLSQTPADPIEAGNIQTLKTELGQGTPLRIFTKIGDSYIIGGLMKAAGTHQLNGRITATYALDKGRLYLTRININGAPVAAKIALSDQTSGQCM
jgi:hypothetical protein